MKKYKLLMIFAATAILWSCSNNKETKTLYGIWDPILERADSSTKWTPAKADFILTVSGKCEDIKVVKTIKGDLANPDIPMTDAKCGGNRDELRFNDTYNFKTTYVLKMDATKDTLIGTATTAWTNLPKPEVVKIKFLRK